MRQMFGSQGEGVWTCPEEGQGVCLMGGALQRPLRVEASTHKPGLNDRFNIYSVLFKCSTFDGKTFQIFLTC